MTRAFGWSVPYMMLVPMADNCNHHCVENYFELFNARLSKKMLNGEKAFNNFEKSYFTRNKLKINFFKHFEEDDKENVNSNNVKEHKFDVNKIDISFKTQQYYKKLVWRDQAKAITVNQFLNDDKYKEM